jgi:hypothetical protein
MAELRSSWPATECLLWRKPALRMEISEAIVDPNQSLEFQTARALRTHKQPSVYLGQPAVKVRIHRAFISEALKVPVQ